jgi:hypothetical protein
MRGWPVAQGSVMRVSQPWPVGYKEVRNGCEAGGRRSHVCTGHVTAGHMGWKHLLQVSYHVLDARCARGALKRQKSRCKSRQPHRLTGTYTEGGETSPHY